MADTWQLPNLGSDRFEFVPCTDDAIEYVALNLRQSDCDEAYATTGHRRYLDAMRLSVSAAKSAVVAVSAYGEPLAVLGVSTMSLLYNVGCPWMVATPRAENHRRALISTGKAYISAMLQNYAELENHVDARNRVSVAWLQRLGFTLDAPAPYGALQLPFHRFHITR